jgi:macrolide-specific efflux system membrane fusion protein
MKKALLIIALAVFVLGSGIFAYIQLTQKVEEKKWQSVTARVSDIVIKIQASGVVEPENKVNILPPNGGRIDEIKVEEGDLVTKGQVIAMMSSTQRAALIDIAAGRKAEDVEFFTNSYQQTPIFAPVSGRIIKRSIVPGQTITNQSTLFEMSDHLVVRARVDETDLSVVALDMAATITVDAFPTLSWPAKVVRIAQQSRLINNVNIYDILLTFESPPEQLRSGMTSNVDFIIDRKDSVVVLPVWAVKKNKENKIRVKMASGKYKEIELGVSDGKYIEVVGLEDSEKILIPPVSLSQTKVASSSPFLPGRRSQSKNGNN